MIQFLKPIANLAGSWIQGKADANNILNRSLTSNVLRDKGIEATSKLAESPNSKVIVIGSGGDGLPIILGNQ